MLQDIMCIVNSHSHLQGPNANHTKELLIAMLCEVISSPLTVNYKYVTYGQGQNFTNSLSLLIVTKGVILFGKSSNI